LNNLPANKRNRRQRRGVGAIIGGVILAAILLTTVLVYFITILNNEKTRTSYEFLALDAYQNKAAEDLTAFRDTGLTESGGSFYIHTRMSNNGSMPVIMSKAVMYCVSASGCPIPNDPIVESNPVTLNAGEPHEMDVGPVSNTLTYRVDIITDRGNIINTVECTVDTAAKICANDNTSGVPTFTISASPLAQAVTAGDTARINITAGSVNGFSSPVNIEFVVSPSTGMATPALSPLSVIPVGTSQMTINTSEDDIPGTYVITITGRSNSTERTVSASVTILEPFDEDELTGRITEGIIQGTGSAQLDFRAFGSIYPTLGSRAGVNQQGWLVYSASPYGNVTGYPAFEVMLSPITGGGKPDFPIVYVEKMRNLDLFNETLTLSRSTSLLTNIGKEPSGQPDIVFICDVNKQFSLNGAPTGGSFVGYDEDSANVVLPWIPLDAGPKVGWEEVYFCSKDPGSGTPNYAPRDTFNTFHPLFVVLRGTFDPSHSDYGQTIPYQSSLQGGKFMNEFEACLRSDDIVADCPGPNTSCDSSGTTCDADAVTQQLIYSASLSQMTGAGVNIWVHLDLVTSPVTVSWIYPDGRNEILTMTNNQLAKDVTLNVNKNVPFEIELPKDVTCNTTIHEQSYIIKISDEYDSEGRRNVYYITWKVTC
jgi:hypothetical protein